jgi:hypothetical protein
MLKRFVLYGIAGWGMEIIWTGLGSLFDGDLRMLGYSNLWMFVIYGCAVFLEPIHDIIRGWNWFFRGIIWTTIIWGMEYTSGLILFKMTGVHPWIYDGPYAVDGLIELLYGPAWFTAGLVFERIHRKLDAYRVS